MGGLLATYSHAIGGEDVGTDFGFGAVGGDFFTVPKEADSGCVADFGYDFAGGSKGCVCGSNESFLADGLTVDGDGDPGIFGSANDQG